MSRVKSVVAIMLLAGLTWSVLAWKEISNEADGHFRIDPRTQRIVRIEQPGENSLLPEFLRPKLILLTIDDGPADTEVDLKILAILKKHHAHALWFITCKTLDPREDPAAAQHRDVLKKIVTDGHMLGNHGYRHLDLSELDAQGSPMLIPEISDCGRLIESLSGTRPKYFRPPYGKTSPRVMELIRAEGMQSVLWTSDSFDWVPAYKAHPGMFIDYVHNNPGLDTAAHAGRGDIVLMHDHPNTAETLDELLSRLESRRFVFVVPR